MINCRILSRVKPAAEIGGNAPLSREQRKLAAILAADVVGYSRLMGRDESGTPVRLREHHRCSPWQVCSRGMR